MTTIRSKKALKHQEEVVKKSNQVGKSEKKKKKKKKSEAKVDSPVNRSVETQERDGGLLDSRQSMDKSVSNPVGFATAPDSTKNVIEGKQLKEAFEMAISMYLDAEEFYDGGGCISVYYALVRQSCKHWSFVSFCGVSI